jgi:hypothetical protein
MVGPDSSRAKIYSKIMGRSWVRKRQAYGGGSGKGYDGNGSIAMERMKSGGVIGYLP